MKSQLATIAVLGAGTMGRGIAHVAALGGYDTRLYDVSAEVLDDARRTIERNLAKGVDRGKVERSAADAALGRLALRRELAAAVAGSDLVIEAVPEDMRLKVELLAEVARHTDEQTLLASNTSGLSITEMAAACGRPRRFAGMHFFNPVHLMRLVELVRGLDTDEETLAAMAAAAARMGKEVVVVRESPGFVTSRVNALIGNEAFRMLESGVASPEDIDKALELGLNHPMGPFAMVDLVGLDVRLSILEHLHATLGESYRPSNLLRQYVKAGRLGRKTRRGVYTYDAEGNRLG
ncbi:MAG TPA: 3-hydroxyacyl-CoA dehydrogenase NAD-binding domain-containing protein [Thermoanaerobaculia bacterium]|nr:3-hydroxyacyl-CoA dehydrogenase NAD-binding domain-containing protein [Thermoanaerobaculia bacterium]